MKATTKILALCAALCGLQAWADGTITLTGNGTATSDQLSSYSSIIVDGDYTIEDGGSSATQVLAADNVITVKSGRTLTMVNNLTSSQSSNRNSVWIIAGEKNATTKPTVKLDGDHGFGMNQGSSFRDITVEAECSGGVWFEIRHEGVAISDETVDMTVASGKALTIGTEAWHSDEIVTLGTVICGGTISKGAYGGNLKIMKTSTATGAISCPTIIGADGITLTAVTASKPSSVTTDVEGKAVKATVSDSNTVYSLVDADELGLLPENWYKFNGDYESSGATEFTGGNASATSGTFVEGAKGVSKGAILHYYRWGNSGCGFANLTSGSWTIVLAAKKSATENGVLLCVGSGDNGHCSNGFAFKSTSTGVAVGNWYNGSNTGDALSLDGTVINSTSDYHLYTLVYDSTTKTYSLYIDDALADSQTTGFVSSCTGQFQFSQIHGYGVTGFASCSDVCVDDFRVYKQALTADQIHTIAGTFLYATIANGETDYYTLTGAAAAATAGDTLTTLQAIPDTTATIGKNVTISSDCDYLSETTVDIADGVTATLAFGNYNGHNSTIKVTGAGSDKSTAKLALKSQSGLSTSSSFNGVKIEIANKTLYIDGRIPMSDVDLYLTDNVVVENQGTLTLNTISASASTWKISSTGSANIKITQSCTYTGSATVPIELAHGVSLTLTSNYNSISTDETDGYRIVKSETGYTYTSSNKYTVTFDKHVTDVTFKQDGVAVSGDYSFEYGSTVSFTVDYETEKLVATVTKNNETMTPTDGSFSFTMGKETVTISATTAAKPQEDVPSTKDDIKVPSAWAKQYNITAENVDSPAACGKYTNAQCYALGLDPDDEDADFTVSITFDENGDPVVTTSPTQAQVNEGTIILKYSSDLENWSTTKGDGDTFFKAELSL